MGLREHRGAIEAILFASGEPISAQRIAQVIGLEVKDAAGLIDALADEYDNRNSGICILKLGDSYQFSTRKQYANQVRDALDLRRNQPLSQASLEVLAIIAYNQPVTKSFAEQVRGVDCSGVFATLCEKELIEEAGRMELPGKPIAYRTTANFLRAFSLSGLDSLPALPSAAPVSELAAVLEAAKNSDDGE